MRRDIVRRLDRMETAISAARPRFLWLNDSSPSDRRAEIDGMVRAGIASPEDTFVSWLPVQEGPATVTEGERHART